MWDAFFYAWLATTLFTTFMFVVYAQMLGTFPGADIALANVVGALGAIPVVLVYAMLASSMPRAGGDYIWISRIVHPAVGFAIVTGTETIVYTLWMVWNGYNLAIVGLSIPLGFIGNLIKSSSLMDASVFFSTTNVVILISIVSIIVPALMLSFGMRKYAIQQRLILAVTLLGTAVVIGVLAVSTRADFISGFNRYFGYVAPDLYNRVLEAAPVSTEFSWPDTWPFVAMMSTGYIMVWYFSPMLGEIKSSESFKSMSIAMIVPMLLCLVTNVVFTVLYLNVAGKEFLASLGTLVAQGNELVTSMGFTPYFTALPLVLVPDVTLAVLFCVIIALAVILGSFFYNVTNFLGPSRYLFSNAFDRILPKGVAYVHPRYHTPLVAFVILGIMGIAWTLAGNVYPTLWLFTSAGIFAQLIVEVVVLLAGLVFPISRAKKVYDASPVKWKVAGVPIISIVALVGLAWEVTLIYFYAAIPALGATGYPPSYYYLAAQTIIAGIAYYVANWWRRREGIELSLAFAQLPPL